MSAYDLAKAAIRKIFRCLQLWVRRQLLLAVFTYMLGNSLSNLKLMGL